MIKLKTTNIKNNIHDIVENFKNYGSLKECLYAETLDYIVIPLEDQHNIMNYYGYTIP